ncbi:MAG: deoxyguanosinetriphosphate triphosphohydrolase [Gemmataceae bacterium]
MPANRQGLFEPPNWLDREEEMLAPYALKTRDSRGRQYPQEPHAYRTHYQRDRDRVVHSTAFRRLMYKTQVLVNEASDHHRTRLTHTLEVAQISRTIARELGLNEDLTEAIALAHDLGHPPFGHAGEDALNECMTGHGGFEHNRHGLRIVSQLEYRYAEFPGLNLTWEVLESMAYHSKMHDDPEIKKYRTGGQPFLEAQVVDAADSLAYDTHDVDDALSVGLIAVEDLAHLEFFRRVDERVRGRHPALTPAQYQCALVRGLIDWQVSDLLENTRRRLVAEKIGSVADVRSCRGLIVEPGPELRTWKAELESFLHRHVYRHYRVMRMAAKGRRFLKAMFGEYCRSPEQLPGRYAERARQGHLERTVCDYLAGMTDRYAQDEYLRLFQPYSNV